VVFFLQDIFIYHKITSISILEVGIEVRIL